jgi:hypothetical protein
MSEANRHTVVIGPTRAGKTASLIAPWIVEGLGAGYVVAACDLKGQQDLLEEVRRYRDAAYPGATFRVRNLDYRNPAGSTSWSFIRELDDDGAVNAAAEAICGLPRDNDPNRSFHVRDLKWARGLLEMAHAAGTDLTVRDLLDVLADDDALDQLVSRFGHTRGAQRLRDLVALDPAERSRATQFLATYFEVLNTDGFVQVTSKPRLDLRRDAFAAGTLLHVNAPVADSALSAAASGLFLALLTHRRLSTFASDTTPMLLVVDEAARLQDRLDLGRLLSLAAGANVSVLLAIQDVNQLAEDRRDEILANCGTTVVMAGAGERTVEYVGRRLGSRMARTLTSQDTYSPGSGRSSGYSVSSLAVPVLGAAELAGPPTGRRGATVINTRLSPRPVLVDLTRGDLEKP